MMTLVMSAGVTDYLMSDVKSDVNGNEIQTADYKHDNVESLINDGHINEEEEKKEEPAVSDKPVDKDDSDEDERADCVSQDTSGAVNENLPPNTESASGDAPLSSTEQQQQQEASDPEILSEKPVTDDFSSHDVKSDENSIQGKYEWHHFSGRNIERKESVEFHRQVDHLDIWADQWSHSEKCAIMEKILTRSNLNQFKFLWTTLQPTLHRDFMYAAQLQFPNHKFPPISSHVTRETKAKRAVRNYHHISSAYLKSRKDILECNRSLTESSIGVPTMVQHTKRKSKRETSFLSQSLPANMHAGHVTSRSAPEAVRRHKQPIRRHMDDYACSKHYPSAGGDFNSMNYHPVTEDDIPRLVKSVSEIQLNRKRPTLSGTSPKQLPPITPVPHNAWQLLHWYSNCWNDVERNEFLHKLLKKLDARQLYYVTCNLSIKQSRDYLSLLPEHLALRILAFLTPCDLLICAQVSRSWNHLSSHNKIWKEKCQNVKIDIPIPSTPKSWKKVYRDNVFLKSNWKEGNCKVVDLRGHTAKVHCVAFDGQYRLASGSKDSTVRVWDVRSGNLIQTLKGHTKGVWSVKFFTSHLLVSASYDTTIRVWNIRNGTCTRTLLGHEGCVWSLALKKHYLASGSQDRSVKVWNLNKCALMHTLTGHAQAVFCVDMDDEASIVISGSADRSVRIWNLHSGQQMKVLWVSQSTSVMAISYNRGYVVCSVGETVSLWRVETGTCIKKYLEHEKRVESVGLRVDQVKNPDKPRGLLVTAGEEGLVKYWNLHSKHSHQTLRASHGSQVNNIYFDETKIVSACADFRIRIWNFHAP